MGSTNTRLSCWFTSASNIALIPEGVKVKRPLSAGLLMLTPENALISGNFAAKDSGMICASLSRNVCKSPLGEGTVIVR